MDREAWWAAVYGVAQIITLELLGYKCFHNYKVFLDLHRIMCGDKL